MRASLNKITTDSEGSSRIIFDVPSSELADVVMLNRFFQKELNLDVKPCVPVKTEPQTTQGLSLMEKEDGK